MHKYIPFSNLPFHIYRSSRSSVNMYTEHVNARELLSGQGHSTIPKRKVSSVCVHCMRLYTTIWKGKKWTFKNVSVTVIQCKLYFPIVIKLTYMYALKNGRKFRYRLQPGRSPGGPQWLATCCSLQPLWVQIDG